jgi:hypothetical protein
MQRIRFRKLQGASKALISLSTSQFHLLGARAAAKFFRRFPGRNNSPSAPSSLIL